MKHLNPSNLIENKTIVAQLQFFTTRLQIEARR